MEKQVKNNFTFNWIIENFSMCHQSYGHYLHSPEFAFSLLPRMKWRIQLYPRRDRDEYIGVFIKRIDDIPETCKITLTMQVLDCKEKSIFYHRQYSKIFEAQSTWGDSEFFKRNSFFMLDINDALIMKFTLKPVFKAGDKQILPPVPYENGLFADVVLRARNAKFKVHKAVLGARWPKLVEKLDIEQTCEQIFDIESDVLEALLKYVYTGKIDCSKSDLLTKIYIAAEKYELSTLHNLQCLPVMAQKARTHVNAKIISFEWLIKDLWSLHINTVLRSHVFSVDILNGTLKWNLKLDICEDTVHGRMFDIFLCKICDPETKPIFVKWKISLDKTNSSEEEHLFETAKLEICTFFYVNFLDIITTLCNLSSNLSFLIAAIFLKYWNLLTPP
ncbi:speckle-type POZ protein B-like [Stegodyphus dumicola]|uniref:speckle-type POZ protein B-like n=1 Tax=Stegodyphus dumicola TaxID=202533 RepID=UPI0015A9DDBC|nr:speckle-type POZ protein B-like [Stegodyphus dumicola]